MAIYKKGADPVALRASAERITAHARDCESVRGEASRAVGALRSQWGGGDLEHLMTRWPPIEAQLTAFGNDLDRLARALVRNAGQQDGASGPTGASGGAGGYGGGAPGPGTLPVDGNGIPGYDTAKSVWSLVKGTATGVGKLGLGLVAVDFLRNLSSWDKDASLLGNVKNLWGAGRLAEFGKALDPKEWGSLSKFVPALEEGGALAKTLGGVGKALGPIGVAFGGLTVANDLVEGNYDRAGYDTVMTGLGAAALLTPPPVDLVLGGAAGVMAVGQVAYDHWDDITDFTGDAVDAVGDFAGDVGDTVGDVADAVWPF